MNGTPCRSFNQLKKEIMYKSNRTAHFFATSAVVGMACRLILESAAHGEGMGIRSGTSASADAHEGDGYARPAVKGEGYGLGVRIASAPSAAPSEGYGLGNRALLREGDGYAQPVVKNEGRGFVTKEEGVGFARGRDGWDGISREGWDDSRIGEGWDGLAQPGITCNEGSGFAHSAEHRQELCLA